MAEIKSTLDIIMEKTKGMTMSEEEKRAFKHKETADKAKGFVQRFLDGFLELERLESEIATLDNDQREMMVQAMVNDLASRIQPGENNSALLQLLEVIAGKDTTTIREALTGFEQELTRDQSFREKEMITLLKARGISGSAIVPNIDSDPDWIAFKSEKEREFKENTLRSLV